MGDSVPLFDVPLYYNHIPVLFEVSDALQFQRVGNLDHESAVSVGGVPKDQVDLRRDGRRTGISHVDHQGRPFGKTWGTRGFEGEPGRNEWNEASPDSFTTRRPFSRHRIRSTCFNVALFEAHTGKTDNPNINLIKGVEKIVLNSVTQGRLTQERYRDCSPGTRRCQKFWGHAHSAARKCV